MKQIIPYVFQTFPPILNNNSTCDRSKATEISSESCTEQFFTLESNPSTSYTSSNSPSEVSISSSGSTHSYPSDLHRSSDITYGVPVSWSSDFDDEDVLMNALCVLNKELVGPDINDSDNFSGVVAHTSSSRYTRILEIAPHMDLKQLLVACAEILSEADNITLSERNAAVSAAEGIMDIVEKMVSVSGGPLQRLGAYMLEGLRARLLSSGSIIYKKLKCNEATSPELMSYMNVIYQMCPYYKFAYTSSNVVIEEAMENENKIHIIDFQIAQGTQWISFIMALSSRLGGPPCIRITGVDDSESAYARGGGLELVGERLALVAESCGVPFEFHAAAMSGHEVQLENLQVRQGEALAVNFPYILHHMPDESVNTTNHRDRLLRLVKSLSPKVVTIIEQESNTNTGTFLQRFCETLDYYTAMFESIDVARDRNNRQRISAEEHCVAKDVVNIIACEGIDRVERHELFGKWRSRLVMAGFSQIQLSSSVSNAVCDMLKEFSPNYRIAEVNGALFLGWKNRAMSTCSAWR